MDLARRDPRAAFVVDIDHELVTSEEACRFTMHYRSVMGTGRIRFLETPGEKRYALGRIMLQYTGRDGWKFPDRAVAGVSIFALVIEELTGKRSGREEAHAGTDSSGERK
jgi:nitroimidazol reductase NimA-like FMN-containing flavoprotein (pyridoxamine 5'-phosphate oxidase superfamily)